jgi:DNA-binding response OmpR family regulator
MTAILVVERDSAVAFTVADAFANDLAAQVRYAGTVSLAVELIETGTYDLAIIDANMPEISGFELARRAANRNVPALLCSGNPDTLRKLVDFEVPHLAKPFAPDLLILEAARVITQAQTNIRKIRETCTQLLAASGRLEAEMARSRALVRESKAILAKSRGAKPTDETPF